MQPSRSLWGSLLLATALSCAAAPPTMTPAGTSASKTPEDEIRSLISKTYDRPDHLVETSPVVVVEDHAIADWTQDERGGRALLRRTKGQWEIVACGGAGFKSAATLSQTGMPAATAQRLTDQLHRAEQSLAADKVKRFDSFGQTVHMQAGPQPAHKDHQPHAAHPIHPKP